MNVPPFRSAWSVSALLLATPPVAAQAPAPVPTEVRLAYKFNPGQSQRYRANLTSQVTLTREGALRPGTLELDGVVTYAEKVLGVRDEVGTVLVTQNSAQATVVASGASYSLKLASGKVGVTRNGQALPAGSGPPGFPPATLQSAPVTLFRTATGQVKTQAAGAGTEADPRFCGMPLVAVAEFPERPVKVGDKWESRRQFTSQGLGPALPGPVGLSNLRLTHELKSVQRQGRRLIAMIETNGVNTDLDMLEEILGGAVEAGRNPPGLIQTLVGVTYFDVERGALMASQFAGELTGVITTPAAPAVPGGAAAGAGTARVDGQIGVRLAEVIETTAPVISAPSPSPQAATPARPTPAPAKKKPAPRRPAPPRRR